MSLIFASAAAQRIIFPSCSQVALMMQLELPRVSVLKQECCNSQEGLRNVRSAGGGFSAEKSSSVSFETVI